MGEILMVRGHPDYSGVLATNRYEVEDVLGQGTWGTVYRARDKVSGDFVALKVLTPTELAKTQMVERKQTPQSVLLNECGKMHAYARIGPRTLDVDGHGPYFLVMPVMKRFLDDVLDDKKRADLRVRLNQGLSSEQVLSYSRDLFDGLGEMHDIRRDVHADIKPENLALDDKGRLYLNDLGTSTCTSLKANPVNSKRGERGFELTRAPECFLGKEPSRGSDVWGAAALVYRMMSGDGQYPLEQEFANVVDKSAYLDQLGTIRLRQLLRDKIRQNILKEHRGMGKLLEKCLDPEPSRRPYSSGLKNSIDYAVGKNKFWKDAWNFTKSFGVVTGAIAAISMGSYFVATAPEHIRETPPKVSGLLHLSEYGSNGERRIYDIEELDNLPTTLEGLLIGAPPKYSRAASKDMSVAFLVDAHRSALSSISWQGPVTDYQRENFWKRATEEDKKSSTLSGDRKTGWDVFLMPARSLEDTLELIINSSGRIDVTRNIYTVHGSLVDEPINTFRGHVDLEDLITISKYGLEKVQNAKNKAMSQFFKDYIETDLFSKDERYFMKMWLAYIHEGLTRK